MMGSVVAPATTTVEQEEEHWLPSVVAAVGVVVPLTFTRPVFTELSTQSVPEINKQLFKNYTQNKFWVGSYYNITKNFTFIKTDQIIGKLGC